MRTNSTDFMAFTHVWILREYDKPRFEIKNSDVIIDIGAHIGLFALYASQFCKKGRIYCFEPVKENFEMLKTNVELNRITNILPINAAVSSTSGKVIIYLNDDEAGHSMYVTSPKYVQVTSTSLKDLIDANRIKKCDFLKIDCEGEEYEIMNSLPDHYFDMITKIVIEYHFADTKPELLANLVKKLREFSFEVEIRKIFSDIGFLYACK
ncbi:MAG: FkbM family methyltransferase [Nitrososphaerota archaeon]